MKGIIADFTKIKELSSIAGVGDYILRTIPQDTMVLQIFQHPKKSINMGLDDTRAPFFHEGIQHYLDNGYTVSTRNSGGRSVANDMGVLNFSLILKNNLGSTENYMMFYNFLKDALAPLNLDFYVGEVNSAYCPGAFDISINGKKVAGTAQRRIGDNVLVGCYLSVNGDQNKRSQIISDFYKITKDVIQVDPKKLTTLQDEMQQDLDVDYVKTLIFDHFKSLTTEHANFDLNAVDKNMVESAKERAIAQDKKYLKI